MTSERRAEHIITIANGGNRTTVTFWPRFRKGSLRKLFFLSLDLLSEIRVDFLPLNLKLAQLLFAILRSETQSINFNAKLISLIGAKISVNDEVL
jgi:hypothetical protein